MKLIIKTLDDRETEVAKSTRDFLQEINYNTIILVPNGVKRIFIFEEKTGNYSICSWSDNEELDVAQGFLHLDYARMYATAVMKEAGLTENEIQITSENMYKSMLQKK
ncbi:hypothetical protein [Neobacillus niacini]|uniref:hypothetical protein n=1 Tax=Neobacillus niacini TaxID=86668 RepID=UPI0005EE7FCD|nr:hypothetical protein [Neobacillus niacini]